MSKSSRIRNKLTTQQERNLFSGASSSLRAMRKIEHLKLLIAKTASPAIRPLVGEAGITRSNNWKLRLEELEARRTKENSLR